MWATLNPRLERISKLRSFAVGFLLVILSSFLISTVVHAATVTGEWFNRNGVISVKVGDREYFNPTQVGNDWLMRENRGEGQCNGQLKFASDPTKSADAAKTAEETIFKRLSNGEGGFDCSLVDQKNTVNITGSPGTPTPGGGATGDGTTANDRVCNVGALGWVICPLINFMGTASDQAATILQSLLFVQPLSLDTGSADNTLYKAWAGILGVANILLALAFLYVIFAQATSVGLSSYGVKKMLPRIIAAAILMNLSYYICAFAVDISNLAGVGITGLLIGATSGAFTGDVFQPDTFSSKFGGNGSISEAIAGIGVGAIIVIWFLVPVLLGILAVLFTLAARLAILVLLVMVAPAAFAAWVLPNTEKYFKKWYELFISMLVLFPLVMAVFAGATIASQAVMDSAVIEQNTAAGVDEASSKVFLPLIALLIQALPLFALPFLFKTAGGALGKINAMAHSTGYNRLGGKQIEGGLGALRKNSGQRAARYGKFGAIAAAKGLAGDNAGNTRLGRAAKRIGAAYIGARAFDKAVENADEARKRGRQEQVAERAVDIGGKDQGVGKAISNFGGSRYQEIVSAQAEEAYGKRVKSIQSELGRRPMDVGKMSGELGDAIKGRRAEETSALISHLSSAGGASGRKAVEEVLKNTDVAADDTAMTVAMSNAIYRDSYSNFIGKRGSVAKGGFKPVLDAQGNATGQQRWQPNLGKVPTTSLVSSDWETLSDHFDTMSNQEARTITENAELWSDTSGETARQIFQMKAMGIKPNFVRDNVGKIVTDQSGRPTITNLPPDNSRPSPTNPVNLPPTSGGPPSGGGGSPSGGSPSGGAPTGSGGGGQSGGGGSASGGAGAAWTAMGGNVTNFGSSSSAPPSGGTPSAGPTQGPPAPGPVYYTGAAPGSASFSRATPQSSASSSPTGGSSTSSSIFTGATGGTAWRNTGSSQASSTGPSSPYNPQPAPSTTRVEYLGTVPDPTPPPAQLTPRPNGPLEITTGRSPYDNPPVPPTNGNQNDNGPTAP